MALALLVCLWCFSVLVLAVVALWFGHIPGFRRSRGQHSVVSVFCYLLGSGLGLGSGLVLCLIYYFSSERLVPV